MFAAAMEEQRQGRIDFWGVRAGNPAGPIGTFYTPPQGKGLLVAGSYARVDGWVIRRRYGQGSHRAFYAVSPAEAG